MSVLIAPDKFKGSLTAREVTEHLTAGLTGRMPGVPVVGLPVADGGEGTLEAALAAGFRQVTVHAEGPTGRPVTTSYAERDGVAVIELADVSGLGRLPGPPAPRTASSYGTGQLIGAALDGGCRRIVLGLGGSACTDGGAGMAESLGAQLVGVTGRGGAALAGIDRLDLSQLHPRLAEVEIDIAIDVDNPLLGSYGAAAVYGPQKGATEGDVADLENALTRWSHSVAAATGIDAACVPGAGAAGGVGYAALTILRGRLRSGIDLILDLVGFPAHLAAARLVVTGEGSLDHQTARGKAPAGVAARAVAAGKPVVAVAGRSLLPPAAIDRLGFDRVYPLSSLEPDGKRSMLRAGPLLELVGRAIADDWLAGPVS
ncbi:glycerate kinase [Nonomuraea typhae]|uniref:glycerate kinase n=1 Tax=Nonomuraea typhae TaxID=2603600 RepID=UPI0012F90DB9|nr:glycerate kinase [Nonomuraea typhae]